MVRIFYSFCSVPAKLDSKEVCVIFPSVMHLHAIIMATAQWLTVNRSATVKWDIQGKNVPLQTVLQILAKTMVSGAPKTKHVKSCHIGHFFSYPLQCYPYE